MHALTWGDNSHILVSCLHIPKSHKIVENHNSSIRLTTGFYTFKMSFGLQLQLLQLAIDNLQSRDRTCRCRFPLSPTCNRTKMHQIRVRPAHQQSS